MWTIRSSAGAHSELVRDEGWLSATNVWTPPIGSDPFGVDGYKTLGYELATGSAHKRADRSCSVRAGRPALGPLCWHKELVARVR